MPEGNKKMMLATHMGMIVALLAVPSVGADEVTISRPRTDRQGVMLHEVKSPYQASPTQIRVLLPETMEKSTRYPVVYVLPVEAGNESRFGDGLEEVRRVDLHNNLSAVFVAPTFADLPWYGDHPTRPELRQESYFLKVVVPFVEKNYPVRVDVEGRLLLGFSKSGWGAWSLLLRHPDLFGKAAAWDAPLMMDRPGKYGSGHIFASEEHFENYRVSKLLEDRAEDLQERKRLILMGYGNFRGDHQRAHVTMSQLGIAHEYRDGPPRKHDWHSGWVKEAVELLLETK